MGLVEETLREKILPEEDVLEGPLLNMLALVRPYIDIGLILVN